VLGGFGLIFLLPGMLLLALPRQFNFDLDRQEMTVRPVAVQRRPLAGVLAVQLIEGGWHSVRNDKGVTTTYFTYQLNLVLDDARRPRLNLTNHSHWESTWQMGQELADFLQVPLLDDVSEDG
jgi:hypothetical protein